MKEIVLEKLKTIEDQFGIRILYPCESGSRAWLINDLFKKSDLPEQPDHNFAEQALVQIRDTIIDSSKWVTLLQIKQEHPSGLKHNHEKI